MKKVLIYLLAICLLLMPLCSSSASAATDRTNTAEAGTDLVPSPAEVEARGDLFYQYLLQYAKDDQDTARPSSVGSYAVGSGLTGTDKAVFLVLEEGVKSIAAGQRQTTVFSITPEALGYTQGFWTAEELGVDAVIEDDMLSEDAFFALQEMLVYDMNKIVSALLADHPYEMYWYNKTVGCYSDVAFSVALSFDEEYLIGFGEDTAITFIFDVADAYAGEDTYTIEGSSTILHTSVDPAKISGQNVSEAVGTARQIVADNASKTDYEKLIAYKDAICGMVSYNFDAAEQTETPYGDPWQMIYVFDGDESTNVVCEGYAKAFQYLCDLSEFSGEVQCYSVTGTMDGGTGEGPHMWNIVHMNDGKNYLADVTNCDEGSVGADDLLFLSGYTSGSASEGYVFACGSDSISYVYDEYTKSVFDDSVLTLSDTTYVEADPDDILAQGENACGISWTLTNGGVLTVSGHGVLYESLWDDYKEMISALVLTEGITEFGIIYGFEDCPLLTEVELPDSLEILGDVTFVNCTQLKSVHFGAGLKTISYACFDGCSGLTEIVIPANVETIGEYAFRACSNLKKAEIYAENIGRAAFSACENLEEVELGEGVISVGAEAFGACTSLRTVSFPSTLTSIGAGAFVSCYELTGPITIPEGVTEIKDNTFFSCEKLNEVHLPDTLKTIGQSAFQLSGITSIDIPDSVESIGDNAFRTCNFLAEVDLGNGVKTIGSAFGSCISLTSLHLPASVESFGVGFLGDSRNLAEITVDENNPSYAVVDGVLYDKALTNMLFCPPALSGEVVIPDTVLTLNDEAFYGCRFIDSVVIPDSVTSVGKQVFGGCSRLKSVVLPNGLDRITEAMFVGCSSLQNLTIPDSVTAIDGSAFFGCQQLAYLYVPSSVTTIASGAFGECFSLELEIAPENESFVLVDGALYTADMSVLLASTKAIDPDFVVPNGVTTIGKRVFYGNRTIKSVFLPDSVKDIEEEAFAHCYSLTNVRFGAGLEQVGTQAFTYCSQLPELDFPGDAFIIGEAAFEACTSLARVSVSSPIKGILSRAFSDCSSLTDVSIPSVTDRFGQFVFAETPFYEDPQNWIDGVLYFADCLVEAPKDISGRYTVLSGTNVIADGAFESCDKLTEIYIPGSVKRIGGFAFYFCTSLSKAEMNFGLRYIGESAFANCYDLIELTIPASVIEIGYNFWYTGGNIDICNDKLNPLTFIGPAPSFDENAFLNVFADLYYPVPDDTWTDIVGSQFGSGGFGYTNEDGNFVKTDDSVRWIPYERELCAEHTWDEGTVILPATTEEEGVLRHVCKVCGASETESIPKIPKVFTVVFDGSGGTGTMDPVEVAEGEELTLPENGFAAPAGTQFKAWQIGAAEYLPGSKYTVEADTTVTALWEDVPVMVAEPELDADAGTLSGTVCCDPSVEGQQAVFVVAFYDGKDRLIDMWSITVVLSDETPITIVGAPTDAEKAKLFILQDGTWVPYCASVVINT